MGPIIQPGSQQTWVITGAGGESSARCYYARLTLSIGVGPKQFCELADEMTRRESLTGVRNSWKLKKGRR